MTTEGENPGVILASEMYKDFFKPNEVTVFRQAQERTQALVTGSAILAHLAEGTFEPNDLDVFVSQEGALDMGSAIISVGYTFTPLTEKIVGGRRAVRQQPKNFAHALDQELAEWTPNTGKMGDRYSNSHIAGVFNFKKEGGKIIQVVATRCRPKEAVLKFYSTAVMNFATHDEVTCLFPHFTIDKKTNLILRDKNSEDVKRCTAKYEARGWKSVYTVTAYEAANPQSEVATFQRNTNDVKSLKKSLVPQQGQSKGGNRSPEAFWTVSFTNQEVTRVIQGERTGCPECGRKASEGEQVVARQRECEQP
ncbi:hypothetical protein VNI00_009942 [Paramarasmius palmivorus]|uniref:Uncharacterized protein n=1 Tax=Paramarasmius palmivorus TaxID=297713 RepID=A0AAW0CKL5_9AGAR